MKKREISPGMIGVVSLFFLFVFTTGQLKTIMFFYLNDTLIEGSGMPVKMVRIAFIMTMKYVATSVIRTICIFNMPVMSGVFTSKSYTKSGDIDDVKILRVDCKFIFGKHK